MSHADPTSSTVTDNGPGNDDEAALAALLAQRSAIIQAELDNAELQQSIQQVLDAGPKALADLDDVEELLDLAQEIHDHDRAEKVLQRVDDTAIASLPLIRDLASLHPDLKEAASELYDLRQLLSSAQWYTADDDCLRDAVFAECRKLAARERLRLGHSQPLVAAQSLNDVELALFSVSTSADSIDWAEVASRLSVTAAANAHTAEACRARWRMTLQPELAGRKDWSEEEDLQVVKAVQEVLTQAGEGPHRSLVDWNRVAANLGGDFQAVQCLRAYQRLACTQGTEDTQPEGEASDEALLRLMSIWGCNWPLVAERLGSGPEEVQAYFDGTLDKNIKSGSWSDDETVRLVEAVIEQVQLHEETYGRLQDETQSQPQDRHCSQSEAQQRMSEDRFFAKTALFTMPWPVVASVVGTRRPEQCRDKWLDRSWDSRPKGAPLHRRKWTKAEDGRLLALVREHPQWSWSEISKAMGDFSARQVRERFASVNGARRVPEDQRKPRTKKRRRGLPHVEEEADDQEAV